MSNKLETMIKSFTPTYDKASILSNISANLVWTYKERDPKNKYIFPHPYKRQQETIDVFARSNEWAGLYPKVTIWYDSHFVTPEAVLHTRQKFDHDYPNNAQKIHLKDIRELAIVRQHDKAFAHESTYFRADLLRVVLSYETLLAQPTGNFLLYADLGIAPLNHDELLDRMTIMNLNQYGVVFSTKKGSDRYENSFHIMGNHQQALLHALKVAVIDLNIRRANNYQEFSPGKYASRVRRPSNPYDQVVYDSYQGLMLVLYDLLGKSQTRLCKTPIQTMNDEDIATCLWQQIGLKVVPDDREDSSITDDFLKLKIQLNRAWYFPTMQSDKFTHSHFG